MHPPHHARDVEGWTTAVFNRRNTTSGQARRVEPREVVGSFEIERHLASGGMADVYIGVHRLLGKRAAIKILRGESAIGDELRHRFLQEALILDRIEHPNVVDIFDVGVMLDGRLFLAMELLDGETLGTRMEAGKIPVLEAIGILRQVCLGLTAAHALGIYHRDLKPDNLFLCQEDGELRVKILDWGIARINGGGSPALTREGAVVGTPYYIAPEQAAGRVIDGRADVYALGAIAYELFLGTVPFAGDSAFEVLCRHLRDAPAPPRSHWPEIPPMLEALLLHLLEKEPDRRPPLSDVIAYLDHVDAALRASQGIPLVAIDGVHGRPSAAGSAPRLRARDLVAGDAAEDGGLAGHRTRRAADAAGRDTIADSTIMADSAVSITWVELALPAVDDDVDISVVVPARDVRALRMRGVVAQQAARAVDELLAEM